MKTWTSFFTILAVSAFLNSAYAVGVQATPLKDISIESDVDANAGSATSMDIVIVYDRAAVDILPKTSADWFAQKSQILENIGRSLDIVSLQVPPATTVTPRLPPRTRSAYAVFSYANYSSPMGQAVGNLTAFPAVLIHLHAQSIEYSAK